MKRPSMGLALFIVSLCSMYIFVFSLIGEKQSISSAGLVRLQGLVASLGSTDLAVSTEARYLRHLTMSDPVVVSMDHPGAIDHFPSSAFWLPTNE